MDLVSKNMVVLGHKGMLGQMVVKYFFGKVKNIVTIEKKFSLNNWIEFFEYIKKETNVIIVNCIGKISQKSTDPQHLYNTNTLLPLMLSEQLPSQSLLIHPSTDCVFYGDKLQPYANNEIPDATDNYGYSKILAEHILLNRKNTYIIRGSIIGLDNSEKARGLLGWFLANDKFTKINGYTNHFWNGITTLEWCKQVEKIISKHKNNNDCSVIQVGTNEYYSKYQMLMLFQSVFNTEFEIIKFNTPKIVDKRLIPDIYSDNLEKQLIEMKKFCNYKINKF